MGPGLLPIPGWPVSYFAKFNFNAHQTHSIELCVTMAYVNPYYNNRKLIDISDQGSYTAA
jgi:hypothetical protein